MQKKKAKNLQPNLFSILDNGDIATNNPIEESDKVNEIQEPLPYVVKTQINTARMISRNPIEWARYLSFERRVHKDNSKEDVNFFANGEIKESSRVYEANEEGFERRITKRYDLIDTIRNKEFFSKEIDTLTYTNSLEELKEQGLEIQLTHHHETHKKTLENGNEIAKEYDYLKDIYQEVERTKDAELVREIIPSISSAEYFKFYNKLPFESTNNENTKLNTNDNEEVKKLEFELAKEVHVLILEQNLLSATDYYSWIDKDDYASFAWKMHRLINEDKLKENHLSADNANKIKQFFFKNIIYVMDEPATHLSVPARKEFRKFLKEYAHKHNTTFVLATHDPFLVDTDHLDEIRIVEKETEGSAIENTFNYPLNNASKDSDALYQIKRSLGVSQNVFHNPQKHQIIFVEGITDYCYLTAFKLYFNRRGFKNDPIPFTFLPISGLKKEPNEMKETIQKLRELDNNSIVLIDDDRKDGSDPQNAKSEQFKRVNKEMGDPIKILQLSSCDENFKQIEHCFSANDKEKYAKNKRMELAMAFKARLLYRWKDDMVSEETKNNFKKLFEWIIWITNLIKR